MDDDQRCEIRCLGSMHHRELLRRVEQKGSREEKDHGNPSIPKSIIQKDHRVETLALFQGSKSHHVVQSQRLAGETPGESGTRAKGPEMDHLPKLRGAILSWSEKPLTE